MAQHFGRGMVMYPGSPYPSAYVPLGNPHLSDTDLTLLNLYDPEHQIVLSRPFQPSDLNGAWETTILSKCELRVRVETRNPYYSAYLLQNVTLKNQ
jgi:hypothetical protein